MNGPDRASERQIQAADPLVSTWLSANAGSGKTRVLTNRVARLLLDRVLPQHILCLTYTKAAATEMQNRLFKTLGAWAMKDDSALEAELSGLGVAGVIDENRIRDARRLFARAIETPGGLKIQTIHSFCASLLRRFPLEAGVSPTFTEMDERASVLLREEIVEEMASGDQVQVVDGVAQFYSGEDFSKMTAEITKHREAFRKSFTASDIWQTFGLTPETNEDTIASEILIGNERDTLAALIPLLAKSSNTDVAISIRLAALIHDKIRYSDIAVLESLFLYGGGAKVPFGAKINSFSNKSVRESLGEHLHDLHELMHRLEHGRPRRISLYSARKTLALYQFAAEFLPEYQKQKLWRGWLDFDDLILKARDLLTDPLVAQWVLYRLDGGIDHILVDEAQDTSPAQWDVIEKLAQEFTTGSGARSNVARTIFVVGDKKQSIYSFQGADPEAFDRMCTHFREKLKQVNIGLQSLQLEYSFRSASPILHLVDCALAARDGQGVGGETKHLAFKSKMPGRADLWPVIEKIEEKEDRDWHNPVDKAAENHHDVTLARMIASEIKRMIDTKVTIPVENDENPGCFDRRPVRAGDFLILVQGRSRLFHEIIRACKEAKLAIAGADRLKIGGELAVKDLSALLSFLAMPEDSLSLAAALRSPLFGWTEQQLYDLAHKRTTPHLWPALRKRANDFPETMRILNALRKDTDYLRPYDLIERILTRYDGRRKLLARLGGEAEDGIDALLTQALAYERMEVPSLTGFMNWLEVDDIEIKRQMDSASDRIRVMTVHGAKGLEAPIVILPETIKKNPPLREELFPLDDGKVVWKSGAVDSPEIVKNARDQLVATQENERMRLLYVAMTRAEKWLIVCAAGELSNKKGDSWYETVSAGMVTADAQDHMFAVGQGKRLESHNWDEGALIETKTDVVQTVALPEWATTLADAPARSVGTLSPSNLGGAKAVKGESLVLDEETAMRRGRQLHRLLEHLPVFPQADWPNLAIDLLSTGEDAAQPDEAESLLSEASKVLTTPDLAFLFKGTALAEVDLTASLPEMNGARIHGTIDRLFIDGDRVLVVDYKSNALVPSSASEIPDGLLQQMGAYAAALNAIYPEKRVEIAILWTKTATLMPIPLDTAIAALQTVAPP